MFSYRRIDAALNKTSPNPSTHIYTHIFWFEEIFESKTFVDACSDWMKDNWLLSVMCSIIYVVLIFTGKLYMQDKQKLDLRLPLIFWNMFLATFSICGTIRMWPEFIYTFNTRGFVYTLCDYQCAYGITGFWTFLFILSKLPELVDTLFIVLRKQELIFLHWYHHATVLIYCWYSYKEHNATGRWFVCMNYLVHSIMYTYYAFRAMRFKIPRFISQVITVSQIIQMVAGLYVNYTAYTIKRESPSLQCHNTYESILSGSIMYLSYFILFFNFFINAYILKTKKKQQEIKKKD